MNQSGNLGIDYLAEGQAQKFLTINNAFSRIDALAQLAFTPVIAAPTTASEGECFYVTDGNEAGQIAIYLNGGFEFVTPKDGWLGFDKLSQGIMRFDGANWQSVATGGAATGTGLLVERITINAATGSLTSEGKIPDNCLVFMTISRVMTTLAGSGVTTWSLGVPGNATRYGNNTDLTAGTITNKLPSKPTYYGSAKPLVVTPDTGTITEGEVAVNVFYSKALVP